MKTLFRLLRRLVVLVCIAAVLLMALPPLAREADRLLYPRKYSRQVEQWAAEYELDPLLVYAFIRTERLRPRRHFQRGGPGADADDRGDLYLAAQQNCVG